MALTSHQDQLDAVAADASRIPAVVEESLRYDSPVQLLVRRATQDTEIAGVPIPAGSTVSPVFASANRDSARFPDGDSFDITRNTQGHVAFGLGPHFCLGAPLARLEARLTLEEMFASMADIRRIDDDPPERQANFILRGMARLPLRFTPRA
jgi:cytochrome P450